MHQQEIAAIYMFLLDIAEENFSDILLGN
jgi:hypothetical protein